MVLWHKWWGGGGDYSNCCYVIYAVYIISCHVKSLKSDGTSHV